LFPNQSFADAHVLLVVLHHDSFQNPSKRNSGDSRFPRTVSKSLTLETRNKKRYWEAESRILGSEKSLAIRVQDPGKREAPEDLRVQYPGHSIFVPRVYRGTWRYVPRLPKSLETDTAVAVPRLLDPEIPRYRRESHQIVG
jgi:hypothetical protein